MFDRLSVSLVVAAVAAFLLVPLMPQTVEAQERARVMVPDLQPTDDSRERFGEDVAEELRDLIDLQRHVAMSERDIDQAAREFEMRYRDLDCTTARQLASQIDVPLVLCGEYHTAADGEYYLEATFYTIPALEEFPVEPLTLYYRDYEQAARHILASFERTAEQVLAIGLCQSERGSQNWEQAVVYCTQALELAPESEQARYALARSYFETEEWENALHHFEYLLEDDPRNDDLLHNAAYVSAQLGDTDRAREYYSGYLEINPDDVNVRLTVAYDLAQAGDYYGAMTLLEQGMEQEPENVELNEAFGMYAFRAALNLQDLDPSPAVAQDSDQPRLTAEVAELYRTAIQALDFVLEQRGAEARVTHAVNIMRAYRQLDELENALEIGQRASEIFPGEARIHGQLAGVQNELGNVDDAIASLERAMELDPEGAEVSSPWTRMGNFLMDAGRPDEAIAAFHNAQERQEQQPDQLASMIFSHAYGNYIQERTNIQRGVELIEEAKEFNVSTEFREQLNFFHGYALMRLGEQIQQPQSLETARRSLPIFQRAREMVQAGEGHAQRTGQSVAGLLDPIDTYIEIQEAIIAREGRR